MARQERFGGDAPVEKDGECWVWLLMAIGLPPHSTLYASSNHGEPVNCKDVRKLLWILGSEISAMGSIETSVEAKLEH